MHVSEVGVEQGVLGFGCTSREYQNPHQVLSPLVEVPLFPSDWGHPSQLCSGELR